jgi:cobalt-precorrin-5B (C1)-methyltransferase
MGDFVGGMLKYLRTHPVAKVTIAGGVGKITKLAQGLLDLHSKRGAVDLAVLAQFARDAKGSMALQERALRERILASNTAAEAFGHAAAMSGAGDQVARAAQRGSVGVIEGRGIEIEVAVFGRDGARRSRAVRRRSRRACAKPP